MSYCRSLCLKGTLSKNSWVARKSAISTILSLRGQHSLKAKLPIIKVGKNEKEPYIGLTPPELKDINKMLFRTYNGLAKYLLEGTQPEILPMFDQKWLVDKGKN